MARDILIVDDEADIRMLISGILEDEDYETRTAAGSAEALAEIDRRRPTLVILDIWLQGSEMDGLEVLEVIKEGHPDLPVLIISGHGNIETAVAAIRKGAYDYLEKPFKSDRLLLSVRRAIEAARLSREIMELKLRSGAEDELIGSSGAVHQLRQTIAKVAPTSSRILITGAPGSGKELVARLIHRGSARALGPFVILNCANMVPEHLDAMLFGIESDENNDRIRIGTFESAHGGTLYLDEVADMPLETQGKILRVLQEQQFQRVNGETTVEVDVRIIASTCRDLQREIEDRRFREDLYYRLNVVPIRIPGLTERCEDIPELARFFLDRAEDDGIPHFSIAEDAVAALQSYEWPGNVRELRNVLERLLIMSRGENREVIRSDMLPPEINGSAPLSGDWESRTELIGLPLREAREAFEREYLMAQINRFGGNISRTANFVGMERSALHRKLKLLGVYGAEKRRQYDA